MGSLPARMVRMRTHPGIAGEVLRLEYTAMSLNPNAKLYGKKTLLEMFDPTEARERACLEAFERELDMPWALYRVHRLFLLSGDGGHRSPYCRKAAKDPQAAQPGPCSGCADTLDSHKVPTAAAVAGLALRRGCCTRTERDDGTIR